MGGLTLVLVCRERTEIAEKDINQGVSIPGRLDSRLSNGANGLPPTSPPSADQRDPGNASTSGLGLWKSHLEYLIRDVESAFRDDSSSSYRRAFLRLALIQEIVPRYDANQLGSEVAQAISAEAFDPPVLAVLSTIAALSPEGRDRLIDILHARQDEALAAAVLLGLTLDPAWLSIYEHERAYYFWISHIDSYHLTRGLGTPPGFLAFIDRKGAAYALDQTSEPNVFAPPLQGYLRRIRLKPLESRAFLDLFRLTPETPLAGLYGAVVDPSHLEREDVDFLARLVEQGSAPLATDSAARLILRSEWGPSVATSLYARVQDPASRRSLGAAMVGTYHDANTLLTLYSQEEHPWPREFLIDAIVEATPDGEVKELLGEMISNDQFGKARLEPLERFLALYRRSDPEACGRFAQRLFQDRDSEVRRKALEIVISNSFPGVQALYEERTGVDQDPRIRAMARLALQREMERRR